MTGLLYVSRGSVVEKLQIPINYPLSVFFEPTIPAALQIYFLFLRQ